MDKVYRIDMRRITGTFMITTLLMMPLLLAVPLPAPVIAQPQEALSDAVGGGTGGTFYLDPKILYTGGVTITDTTYIYGRGAMIDLQFESITVTGAYLYIERCTITNGTSLPLISIFGALEFRDGASGFVYNNIIVGNNDNGIVICESSDIVIKENSILHNYDSGVKITDSTEITILENIIANNGIEEEIQGSILCGINGDNYGLYDDDPNSLHNIIIKGNDIFENGGPGVILEYMNGVSISSNLIHSNQNDGIFLITCPIVSMTYNKILANDDGGISYYGDEDWPILNEGSPDEVEVALSLTISNNKIMGNGIKIDIELIEQLFFGIVYDIHCGIFVMNTQNVVITYNEIEGNALSGILLLGFFEDDSWMEHVFIAYNTINGNTMGIVMFGVSDVKIIFNNIIGNNLVGAFIWNDICVPTDHIIIKANILKDNLVALIVRMFESPTIEWNTILNNMVGVYLESCPNPQVIRNTIMYHRGFSMDLGEIGFLISFLGIPMDYIFNRFGLYLYACDGARVAYNTISYNVGHQIVIEFSADVIIEDNLIMGGSESGIWALMCEDLTIKNNKITDNGQGIIWEGCSGRIADNLIGYIGSLSGNDIGINVTFAENTEISDNTIIGNNVSIYCINSDPTIIRDYIANNVYGIYLTYDSDPLIGGTNNNRNYIIRNFADGIYIADADSDPFIEYNNIFENVGYGINNPDWEDDFKDEARYNWWGDISGPGDPAEFGVGPGIGDEISNNFTYSPWLTSVIP